MRIRTIKPEFWESESLGRVSREARLLFIGLFTCCDDSGRARAGSRLLASRLYPYDTDAVKRVPGWLSELEAEKCIRVYQSDGETYLDIPKWLSHQKIDRPSQSKLPPFARAREDSRNVALEQGTGNGNREQGKEQGKEPQTPETPPAVTQDPLEIPTTLKTPDFVRAWGIWMNVRRGMKKPGNWVTLFRSQLDWLAKYDPATATEILSASTRNGWTGLFEPKSNANHASRGPTPGARKNFTSTADNAAARIREIESVGDTWPEDQPPVEPPGMAQEPL